MQRENHAVRIAVIWAVLSAIATPIVFYVWGPHMPPGMASHQAADQTGINRVLGSIVTPIILFIWVQFGYSFWAFRQKKGEPLQDGAVVKTNGRVMFVWIAITAATVLSLAAWATVELDAPGGGGVGGGQGPNPLAVPKGVTPLQVQVIGQQWTFTFRYPTYGGMETTQLYLPANTVVELHVTSLDVIHSFWAWKLGVKADAVPGNDNVAIVQTQAPTPFSWRCAELCGLFHGEMDGFGRVVSQSAFQTWAQHEEVVSAPITKYLPPYARVYYPDPNYRAG